MSRIRKGAITAVAAAMTLVGAAPVHASAVEAAPCQFLMPITAEDVAYCVCVRVGQVVVMVLPDSWACAAPQ